jgi:hypothetical protein
MSKDQILRPFTFFGILIGSVNINDSLRGLGNLFPQLYQTLFVPLTKSETLPIYPKGKCTISLQSYRIAARFEWGIERTIQSFCNDVPLNPLLGFDH